MWVGDYPSAEQSVYSTAPADWAPGHSFRGVLPLCREAVGVFYSRDRFGNGRLVVGVMAYSSAEN